ncbi:bifunctional UDP-N-acetylglucosamine pyrophosphorylase/glucosamine-1-phosphate N-acetyltransferase [Geothermobacter ehrlichii]|uniref:Bifunctional protein GlmU n=1 Tax=Geothermobacter ehrlichii TaxID=213224 RepID=A0A5D3WHJ3_9BACT|nr:bifunctional UDP-N-acetylglucosamine diphosphorylase/glucosamine-1-phosphate N-acetyltransferase GlmU [Geothermobacter ehrlichii]TYO96678.1 bifunctional UDP-N-acetylglucosamine pyrophosphorylase/glucosamine-1-phosphate N-acetyltransferase [Geothermobacter ehrlichii]
MEQQTLAAVILAAGQGTRMKSSRPKVLHPLAGRPMVAFPLGLAEELGCDPTVLVVGHGADRVREAMAERNCLFVEQRQQLGTGHALLCAGEALAGFSGDLLLLCGDVPLLRTATLRGLLDLHRRQQALVTVLTAHMEDPTGYGRIVRDAEGSVQAIVEEKDASEAQRALHEVNTGIYLFRAPFVFEVLAGLGCDNAQGEYYLTDVVAAAVDAGGRVCALQLTDAEEAMGVNDRRQLAVAEAVLRRRINEALMRSGVGMTDPQATYVDAGVEIGPDTQLLPGTVIRGATRIGAGCTIGPHVVIDNCRIADNVRIKAGSVLAESEVGPETDIGPMAHLRPGTVLAGENKIGNFVETKKAQIGRGSKASHLTYLGDCELGTGVNIGCGTITCNYDGVNKYRTVIEDDVFVGSDTQFIAPVTIGRNSLIGAGSTITKDVPPDSLALSRAEQKVIEGWRLRRRKKRKNG